MFPPCPHCGFVPAAPSDRCPGCGVPRVDFTPGNGGTGRPATVATPTAAPTVAMPALVEGGQDRYGATPPLSPQPTLAMRPFGEGAGLDVDRRLHPTPDADSLLGIDLQQLSGPGGIAPGSTRPSGVSPTLALTPPLSALDETAIEGLEPVRLGRGRRVVSASGRRRQLMSRSMPLLLVVLVGLLALGAAGYGILRTDAPGAAAAGNDSPTVTLAAGTFVIGLTEDNKDSVLQGCFRLSGNPNHECRRAYLQDLGEYPSQQVTLPAFRIDRDEVSNRAWDACVQAGGCPVRPIDACRFYTQRGYQIDARVPERMRTPDMPATCVTRDEATAYCRWAGGRLPTPQEWERAARGGDDRLTPWGDIWAPHLMNWAETDMGGFPVVGRLDGYDLTAPVDRFIDGATTDGVRNMFGNAAEWVAPAEGLEDGTRGGSYTDDLRNFRVTYQRPLRPDSRRSDVGFRCVYE